MVLQAHKLGWHAHQMVGFDRERAREVLSVPDGFALEGLRNRPFGKSIHLGRGPTNQGETKRPSASGTSRI